MKTKTYQLSIQEKTRVLQALAGELNKREDILFAYAYGSFAEENDLPVHDIDVGVYVAAIEQRGATPYALELGALLSKISPVPAHVVVVNHAPIPFLYQVISGTVVFSRNEEVRSRVAEHAISRYLDIKPLLLQGLKEAFAA